MLRLLFFLVVLLMSGTLQAGESRGVLSVSPFPWDGNTPKHSYRAEKDLSDGGIRFSTPKIDGGYQHYFIRRQLSEHFGEHWFLITPGSHGVRRFPLRRESESLYRERGWILGEPGANQYRLELKGIQTEKKSITPRAFLGTKK